MNTPRDDRLSLQKPDPRYMAGVLIQQSFDCDDPLAKRVMQHAAEDYERKARSIERAAKSLEVFELSSKASAQELLDARKRGAVRYCGRIYPPVALDRQFVLPSVLLRSALFSTASGVLELSDANVPIVKTKDGDVSLEVSGPRLNGQDRRVLAGCLELYRGIGLQTVPLGQEIELSLHRLAVVTGVKPGRHVYDSLRSSLKRLNAVRCKLSMGSVELPLRGLLTSHVQCAESGKQTVMVRVDEEFAVLLRRGLWVSMPTDALIQYSGLVGWLVCYLRTQSEPFPLSHDYLLRHSGSTCGLAEFRRRLKMAITTLSGSDVDRYLRIGRVYCDPKSVVFMMARWPEAMGEQPLKKVLELQRRYSR